MKTRLPSAGDVLKEEGMDLALEAQQEWSNRCDAWLSSIPSGAEFTSEALISIVGLPNSPRKNANNAIGAKMRAWGMEETEKVGYQKTTRPSSHSRVIAVWRKR